MSSRCLCFLMTYINVRPLSEKVFLSYNVVFFSLKLKRGWSQKINWWSYSMLRWTSPFHASIDNNGAEKRKNCTILVSVRTAMVRINWWKNEQKQGTWSTEKLSVFMLIVLLNITLVVLNVFVVFSPPFANFDSCTSNYMYF